MLFKNIKDLGIGDSVVISSIPGKKVEIGTVVNNHRRHKLIVVKVYSRQRWLYLYYDNETGTSADGRKILQEDDLAIKEAPEIKCPHCHVLQKNFFMAGEFLEGGKRFFCYHCGNPIFLFLDGRFFAMNTASFIRCPSCNTPQWNRLTAQEIAQGGGNRKCNKCYDSGCKDSLLWVDTKGNVKKVVAD